jgi:hypothetical protein
MALNALGDQSMFRDFRFGEEWIKFLGVQIVKQHTMSIVPGGFAHGGGYGMVETVGVLMT